MAKPIGGNAYFKIDGEQYATNGEFTVNIIERQASAIKATNGEMLYTEEAVPSTISGTVYMTEELDAKTLVEIRDATVTVELNNGKVAVLVNAVQTGDGSIDVQAGTMDIELMGTGKWA